MSLLPGYTLIGEFGDQNYVAVLKSRFDAAGIEFVVLGESLANLMHSSWGTGRGGRIRVLVRDDRASEAMGLIE